MEFVSLDQVSVPLFRWPFSLWQHLSSDGARFHSLGASPPSNVFLLWLLWRQYFILVWELNFLSWSVERKKGHPSVTDTIKYRLCFWKLKKFKGKALHEKLLLSKNTLLSQAAGVNCTMGILSQNPDLSLALYELGQDISLRFSS